MADSPRIVSVPLAGHDLTREGSWLAELKKVVPDPEQAGSAQGSVRGRVQHLIDHDKVADIKDYNVHHSAALEAKARAAVGLGHKNPAIAQKLNEFCAVSWQDTLDAIAADFFEFANGYLEVVRNEEGDIRGLYHLPARDVWVEVEQDRNVFHYEIADKGGLNVVPNLTGLRFARFGDRDAMIDRLGIEDDKSGLVSEVIHFPLNRGRRSPYYGYPDWIAATPAMELDQCVTQYAFDFFFNGAMPEAIYTVLGQRVDQDDWKTLEEKFKEHAGIGKRRKLMLLNFQGQEMSAQLDKLTLDGQTTGDNQPLVDACALKTLSAHRTPPILAGVQIPGKLGAANEITNALMAFQLLVVGSAQKQFSQIFAGTLGNKDLNGDLGLTADDFLGVGMGDQEPDPNDPMGMKLRPKDNKGNGFHTILDEIDLGSAETVSKMRMSVSEANARERDLSAGVAERGSDISAGRGRK